MITRIEECTNYLENEGFYDIEYLKNEGINIYFHAVNEEGYNTFIEFEFINDDRVCYVNTKNSSKEEYIQYDYLEDDTF